MPVASATRTIAREPQEGLRFVLDLDRCRQADREIGTVVAMPALDEHGRRIVRYRGMRGMPTPVDTQDVELVRWPRLTITGAAGVWIRRFTDFEGSFRCTPVDGGTEVTHREDSRLEPPPLERLAEAVVGGWLRDEVEREMDLVQQLVEAEQTVVGGVR